MKNNKKYAPEPLKLSEVFSSMTRPQELQFEAIIDMIAALLVAVQQTQAAEYHDRKS